MQSKSVLRIMKPLINQFTKNLSGCSGCGNNDAVYQTWSKAKQLGEEMKFQLVVVVESGNLKEAVGKIPDGIEVISAQARPEPKTPISPLPGVPTNMRTGQPVNG